MVISDQSGTYETNLYNPEWLPQLYAVSQLVCFVFVGIEYPELKERANVPEVVIGEPVTVKPVGTVIETEVTVPVLFVQVGVKYSNPVAPELTLNN